ncbi:uncharacterized protein VNE69_01282 [Vairimorpha necatrix]|uniref:Uncharacterized protein n=1 Tax=Vairimorpha necatrix TaxID=6039 RepID=A0AAX4J8N9_9MICR
MPLKSINIEELDTVVDAQSTLLQCKSCQDILYADKMRKHSCLVEMKKLKKQRKAANEKNIHGVLEDINDTNNAQQEILLTDEEKEKFNSPAYLNYILDIKPVVSFHYKMPNLYKAMMNIKRVKNVTNEKTFYKK